MLLTELALWLAGPFGLEDASSTWCPTAANILSVVRGHLEQEATLLMMGSLLHEADGSRVSWIRDRMAAPSDLGVLSEADAGA